MKKRNVESRSPLVQSHDKLQRFQAVVGVFIDGGRNVFFEFAQVLTPQGLAYRVRVRDIPRNKDLYSLMISHILSYLRCH